MNVWDDYEMRVAILAGGLGTRIREETEFRPKPMVFVGNKPILWHIMRSYAKFGHKEFVICAGYRGEVIREYFREYESLNSDFTVKLGESKEIKFHNEFEEKGWEVTVTDTGQETMTGGRIKRIQPHIGNETFMLTYGDGLSDVNIKDLVDYHHEHHKLCTVTTVQPSGKFGAVEMDANNAVLSFLEKPKGDGAWINGGFFVCQPEVFNYLTNDTTVFEQEPMEKLANSGNMMAFKHEGFWRPMDTLKDKNDLNALWNQHQAPWKVW